MSSEILILLFLALSIISSLINRMQERRRKKAEEMQPPPQVGTQRPDVIDPAEENVDLSEWGIFMEPEEPAQGEFQEVQGKRPVSEADTGPEFREVSGTRRVEEVDVGPEFREVSDKREVSEAPLEERPTRVRIVDIGPELARPRPARPRKRIRLTPRTIRQAIIYNEIIGRPRADRPFSDFS